MHPVAKSLVDELDNHIRILQAAKSAVILSSKNGTPVATAADSMVSRGKTRKVHKMSAATRKKMSQAMKQRWATAKKTGKQSL